MAVSTLYSRPGTYRRVSGLPRVDFWPDRAVYSDYFTTAVRTRGKAGDPKGISFLLIPNGEGVTRRRMYMSGQHCAGTTILNFEDVKVPVENLIGKEHEGFKMIMSNVS